MRDRPLPATRMEAQGPPPAVTFAHSGDWLPGFTTAQQTRHPRTARIEVATPAWKLASGE